MATGTATIDFGNFSARNTSASVAVTGQGSILSGSLVEAWLRLDATSEHSIDEVMVAGVKVYAGSPVAGTGFTIYAISECGPMYGTFKVNWAWA